MPSPSPRNSVDLHRLLTDREREVMSYVAAHHRSKSISRLLGTAPKTVDAQVANACRKLGAGSRDEAVRMLLAAGVDLAIRGNPLSARAPIPLSESSNSTVPFTERTEHECDNDDERDATIAGRRDAEPDVSRPDRGIGPDRQWTGSSSHDPLSGLRSARAGPVSDGSDDDVRNRPVSELSGGHRDGQPAGWLKSLPAPVSRILLAVVVALVASIIVPAGLMGAVALQKTIESLQNS
ncbi:MAG: hypothetical protein DCF28_07480 [Alphaproteobacteria bacterium]|nr:MAG: hypothetical protein DCF28_07480 [Alphaproteobacteria bacterium]PZO36345.1 MAG: hypothetical protein DCE92_09030 [Alphaproteobacteria bacterium]